MPAPSDTPQPSNTVVPPTRIQTLTALPLQAHAFDVPFRVSGQQFLFHRVLEGENFETLENAYQTTSDVTLAINYSLSSPLWANRVIVLAPGTQIVDPEFIALEPYKVLEEQSIDELAQLLNTDATLLRYYNNYSDNCPLVAGDWLTIPRLKK